MFCNTVQNPQNIGKLKKISYDYIGFFCIFFTRILILVQKARSFKADEKRRPFMSYLDITTVFFVRFFIISIIYPPSDSPFCATVKQ